jgi:DNA repair protein RecO (recombination protein O)
VLETADRLTAEEKEPSLRLFLLVIGALRSLAEQTHPSGLVLDAFLLRAMSVAGWEPALSDCARCAEPGPHRHFSVPAGGSVCPACRPTGSAMPNPVTIALLEALLSGDWELAEGSQGINRREGSGLVAALLQWHLERGLRSLSLVERS